MCFLKSLQIAGTIVTFELVLLDRGNRDYGGPMCEFFEKNASIT